MDRLTYSKSKANLDANPNGFSVIGRLAEPAILLQDFVENLTGEEYTRADMDADFNEDNADDNLSKLMSEAFAGNKLKAFNLRGLTRAKKLFYTDDYDVEYLKQLKMAPDTPFYYKLQMNDMFRHVYNLPKQLGLQEPNKEQDIWVAYQYHIQLPGNYQPNVIDECQNFKDNNPNSEYDTNPDLLARFEIMLTPQHERQARIYNGNKLSWNAGDVIYYPWRNTMHSHVNNSPKPMIWLQVTGWTTPEAAAVVAGKDQVFKLDY